MSTAVALWVVRLAEVYLAVGLIFAVPFAARWVGRVDMRAREGTWGFRLLIVPGVVLWWPLLVSRLARGVQAPQVGWTAHRAVTARRQAVEERT